MRASSCAEPGCPDLAVRRGRCRRHQTTTRASTWRWRKTRAAVIARDRGVCYRCHRPGATDVHHLIAVADGGTDAMSNLVASHEGCH